MLSYCKHLLISGRLREKFYLKFYANVQLRIMNYELLFVKGGYVAIRFNYFRHSANVGVISNIITPSLRIFAGRRMFGNLLIMRGLLRRFAPRNDGSVGWLWNEIAALSRNEYGTSCLQ